MTGPREPIRERHPWSLGRSPRERRAPLMGLASLALLALIFFFVKRPMVRGRPPAERALSVWVSSGEKGINVFLTTADDNIADNAEKQGARVLWLYGRLGESLLNRLQGGVETVFAGGEGLSSLARLLVNCPVRTLYVTGDPSDSIFSSVAGLKLGLSVERGFPVPAGGFLSLGSEITAQVLSQDEAPAIKVGTLGASMLICPAGEGEALKGLAARNPGLLQASLLVAPRPGPALIKASGVTELVAIEGDYPAAAKVVRLGPLGRDVRITVSENDGVMRVE